MKTTENQDRQEEEVPGSQSGRMYDIQNQDSGPGFEHWQIV